MLCRKQAGAGSRETSAEAAVIFQVGHDGGWTGGYGESGKKWLSLNVL